MAASPDDRYAFVARETADDLAVFDLGMARAHGYGPAAFVGAVPLGVAPVGLAVAPGGRWLYATNEACTAHVRSQGIGRRVAPAGAGTLAVLNLARATASPPIAAYQRARRASATSHRSLLSSFSAVFQKHLRRGSYDEDMRPSTAALAQQKGRSGC